MGAVDGTAGTAQRSVESVPGVKLETGLAGPDLDGCRVSSVGEQGGSPELLAALAENVVVVVAAGEPELVTRPPIRSPMSVGPRKSNGVPSTDAIAPVGIRSSSIGV
jgi:hypothetical protein